jgi:hypothetical protein
MSTELQTIEPEMATEMTPQQMLLFLGDDNPKIDYSKPEFSYTAERLWRDRPDVAKAGIKLLAEPREVMPYRRIMSKLHISYHLLRALERQSADKIAETKKSLAELAASVTEQAFEKTAELLPGVKNAKDAAIIAGISGDKMLQFAGEAIGKIEVHHKIDLTAKIDNAYKKIIEEFNRVKQAQVIEVAPEALRG